MKERIQAENWIQSGGRLIFSQKGIELSLKPEETGEGVFSIAEESGKTVEGFVWSKDERMHCLQDRFAGKEEQIAFRFDSTGLEEGEEWTGRFLIVSNVGEYELPYVVRICCGVLQSSMGDMKNLFHFTNLARSNWPEAVKLFYHQEFIRVFQGEEETFRELYRGLSRAYGSEQNVEEFLLAAGKKQPVEYVTRSQELVLTELKGTASEDIVLTRNGWGYTRLEVETDGDFLHCEKSVLGDDDFLGNQCRLPVFLDAGALHMGKNFGQVKLTYRGGEIRIPVTVMNRAGGRVSGGRYREEKELRLKLVQLYQEFRMKRIGMQEWIRSAMEVVERLKTLSEKDPSARLFQAHLLITEERMEEAGWILEQIQKDLEESRPEVYAYYLYLTTLAHSEEETVARAASRVMDLYHYYSGNWKIAWLLLFLSREVNRSMVSKWQFLEEQLEHCASPVMYLEALQLMNANPTIVMKLGSVELRTFYYGAKKKFLSADLIGHFVYLAGKQRYFNETVYRILKLCYEKNPTGEILFAICVQLIKGNRTDRESHGWYKKGVEKELRVTRLFEYFMLSLDLEREEEIPRIVLLYFAYQSNLDMERAACLYAYVEKRKDSEPDLYVSYKPQMDRFILKQLYQGSMNRHLAFLYQSVLEGHLFTEDNCRALAPLLFLQQLDCENPSIRQVIVLHRQLKGEIAVPLIDGRAYVPVYGKQAILLLEDEKHNRYYQSVPYQVSRLMYPLRCVDVLQEQVHQNLGCDLFLTDGNRKEICITEETASRFLALADRPEIAREYGWQIRIGLLRYELEKDRLEELDEFLEHLEAEQIRESERAEVVRCLVLRGFYEKAYQWMRGERVEKQDGRTLMRLASRLLEQEKHRQEPLMTAICQGAFRLGTYDSRILEYLCVYGHGSVVEMKKLRRAAENFAVDTYWLTERILVQQLFTGASMQTEIGLLRDYVSWGGKTEIEAAVLHRLAYGYVMQEKEFAPYAAQEVIHMTRRKETLSDMTALAFLQYYEENRQLRSREVEETAALLGASLLQKKIRLPVLKAYADLIPGAEQLLDKTFVVYRGKKECPVVLHYKLYTGGREPETGVSIGMQHVVDGIFAAEFILFPGEQLQYLISEGGSGKEMLDSGLIRAGDCSAFVKGSRYGMLSDVAAERLVREGGEAAVLLEQYLYTDFMAGGLFSHVK